MKTYIATWVVALTALGLGLYVAVKPYPSIGQKSATDIATSYVNELAAGNSIIIESESIQAVRQVGNGAIVLVKIRFHQEVYGLKGPSQDAVIRVRESKSLWNVTSATVA